MQSNVRDFDNSKNSYYPLWNVTKWGVFGIKTPHLVTKNDYQVTKTREIGIKVIVRLTVYSASFGR